MTTAAERDEIARQLSKPGNEIRRVPGHTFLLVSSTGEVFELRQGVVVPIAWYFTPTSRYPMVKGHAVHRLVARAFFPGRRGAVVRHLDDNPLNCCVSNLAYGSYKDNAADRIRNQARRCEVP